MGEAGPTIERVVFGGDYQAWFFETLDLRYDQRNAAVVGIAMGFAVIPIIFSIAEDAFSSVPQTLAAGSLALGANRWQTVTKVVLPTASPGIFSAIMVGFGRAVGETMIVVMAAGQGARMGFIEGAGMPVRPNPLEAVTTVTVQIVMLITGDTEASTAAGPAFTLGFTLFCVTLLMNVVAQRIVRKYRELYD